MFSGYNFTCQIRFLFFLLSLSIVPSLQAQTTEKDSSKVSLRYTNKGFQLKTADDKFLLHLESRLQFRFASPGDQNPLTLDDLETDKSVFKINRARLKVGGHAFNPDLTYYWEYELGQGNLLDFRVMYHFFDELQLKVGQWKTFYNRERVISSGKQQLVDRSIINRPFTVDRQQGVSLFGRVFAESLADITYHFSVLTGMGRGAFENDDNHFMYVGRLQWNFLGRELGMTSSDLEVQQQPVALIALAGLTNRSPFTRFSQSGGGQLVGFEEGENGQYRINQGLIETAFMYKGFSWQNEFHHKQIEDRVNGGTTTLVGSYYQAGYFFHNILGFVPKPLELAARYARFTPDDRLPENLEEEYSLAVNWFFKGGHRNKLTAEVSVFDFQTDVEEFDSRTRFRIQWDISF